MVVEHNVAEMGVKFLVTFSTGASCGFLGGLVYSGVWKRIRADELADKKSGLNEPD